MITDCIRLNLNFIERRSTPLSCRLHLIKAAASRTWMFLYSWTVSNAFKVVKQENLLHNFILFFESLLQREIVVNRTLRTRVFDQSWGLNKCKARQEVVALLFIAQLCGALRFTCHF